jgi:hypothetical protein
MALTFPKGALITINSTDLSDHNRSGFQDNLEELKTDNRTVNGTMRRYFISSKRKFSFSWENLPALDTQTVDGKAGRNSIRGLHDANMNSVVTLTYKEVNGSNVQVNVSATCFIDSYSETLVKRYDRQFWNVEMTLIEQ